MLAGHVAVGLAAKRLTPRVSLGTLVLAAVLPDILWCVFLLAGLERVDLRPGRGAVNYLSAVNIPLSHSLLMNAVWGALLAGAYFAVRRDVRAAIVLFAAVLSHWVLDFISHVPDMTLAPGLAQRYGLGLWSSTVATLVVEGGMWIAAMVIYLRGTRAAGRAGIYGFWIAIAIVTLAWRANMVGPPPHNPRAMAASSLIFFSCTVAWAYWMNHVRPACYNSV